MTWIAPTIDLLAEKRPAGRWQIYGRRVPARLLENRPCVYAEWREDKPKQAAS